MSILPWDNFIKDCYIRLENLVIDGSIKELEEEWSLEGLESAKNTASKFVIYPKSKYDIEDYQNLKTVAYTNDRFPTIRKFDYFFHNRRKSCYCPRSQIISV